MCNNLSVEKKSLVLASLAEGNSIRSTERLTGVHRDTIMRLLVKAGEKAQKIHDSYMHDLKPKNIQADEIWCFVGKKQKHLTPEEKSSDQLGDQYVFVALDADSKLVPSYFVGKRDSLQTYCFIKDLASRINIRFQLSTDSFLPYFNIIDSVFGKNIDYAQINKIYRNDLIAEKRYSPAQIVGIDIKSLSGNPNPDTISTSYVERQNLTMRMQMRRFTRLTNGYSKKLANLQAAVHLHFFYYNFMRLHKTIKVTPAMEAGISNRIWCWNDLLLYN
jgi:IS1 family transposase